jgi:hypothetical protein
MNNSQELWWRQARSDLITLKLLRRHGADACHQLHYLQMVTEKLSKACFWRAGTPPPRSHSGFAQFLRRLGGVPMSKRKQLIEIFGFGRFKDFQNWIRAILPLAYSLERLAPALARDGPNPEYPWPQDQPQHAPAIFGFPIMRDLSASRGRQLIQIVEVAVSKFPSYG